MAKEVPSIAAYVAESTAASGVPVKVTERGVLLDIARLITHNAA